jgi:hypothetical protein
MQIFYNQYQGTFLAFPDKEIPQRFKNFLPSLFGFELKISLILQALNSRVLRVPARVVEIHPGPGRTRRRKDRQADFQIRTENRPI